ncbi:MAG: ribokinase [Bacteroidales bacterium]
MKEILVIGSSNTDMVIKTAKLPAPGETILGGTFLLNPGGKGANQAVAAKRLGGRVTFVGKRGNDLFGNQTVGLLMREGIDTEYFMKDTELPSGVALITVDTGGENMIVVAPGANANLQPEDLPEEIFDCKRFDILLIQLEIPMKTVEYAIMRAGDCNIRAILNPAPAQPIPLKIFENLWALTPNEVEAETLTGIQINDTKSCSKAAQRLKNMGVKNVVITLGEEGAYINSDSFNGHVPGVKVEAIDTTAAGDVFNGALAVALAEGKQIKEAVEFANQAAAISVTRMGAQTSAPFRNELQ